MSFKVRTDFSNINTSIGRNSFSPANTLQTGKVYGVVTTENTPTEKQFKRAGGFNGIGTIFYIDYQRTKNVTGSIDDNFLDTCQLAIPLNSQTQYYPVLNELVYLIDLPSATSQVSNTSGIKYYASVINVFNNPQQNSQPSSKEDILGTTFVENPQIRSLLSFEGDHIVQGRQGNGIRFSTTSTSLRGLSEWSSIGKNDDPIMAITNGFSYDKKEKFHIEKINKDLSSIYLTSAQKIPLTTDKRGVLNNQTNPINVPDYFNAQIILNSDRVVLNSKKDEVMIFAKTNIELNTKNIINLNADRRVHLNAFKVWLGSTDGTQLQPVLLGRNTLNLLQDLQRALTSLGQYMASATSTKEGAPLPNINVAGKELLEDMKTMADQLNNITSKRVYTR
jgi:hypothetical protein